MQPRNDKGLDEKLFSMLCYEGPDSVMREFIHSICNLTNEKITWEVK